MSPSSSARVSLRALHALAARLREEHVDLAAVFGELTPQLADASVLIPASRWSELWRQAERIAGPDIGLRASQRLDLRPLATIGSVTDYLLMQLIATAATLDDAVAAFARYISFSFGSSTLRVDRSATATRLVLGFGDLAPPRSLVEHALALVLHVVRDLTVAPVRIRRVELAIPAPPDRAAHDRILAVPLRFAAAEHAVVLATTNLSVAMRGSRPDLHALVRERIEQELVRRGGAPTFRAEVAAVVERLLRFQRTAVSADEIADTLGVSTRTLSRRLAAEDTSHRKILDDLRAELALRYLEHEGLGVAETARRLGFADGSAFHRAFRRWYGRAPTESRGRT